MAWSFYHMGKGLRYPLDVAGSMSAWTQWWRGNSCSARNRTQVIHPVAIHYADLCIPTPFNAHSNKCNDTRKFSTYFFSKMVLYVWFIRCTHNVKVKCDSSVGIATGYGFEAGRGKRLSSAPKNLERLWGPPNFLYKGYKRAPSPGVQR
jgi:hypothetical protein